MEKLWAFCVLFTGVAVIMDIKWEKVSNFWILSGVLAGVGIRYFCYRPILWVPIIKGILFPLLLMFPLFVFHMIGTGDIKVFMVIGSLVGYPTVLMCIALSFLFAAIAAVPILIFRCDWKERFSYFISYINKSFYTKSILPYQVSGKRPENIHFTIFIFLSICVLM